MSKKIAITDPFQPKITRNDRFAQMSHQEKVIEQKKKEIEAKLAAKQLKPPIDQTIKPPPPVVKPPPPKPTRKIPIKKPATIDSKSKNPTVNVFSNDGSFLDTFKQLKEKKPEKKSFKNDSRSAKSSRWSQRRRSPSPKKRVSRFSAEKSPNFEQKITINTSSFTSQAHNFDQLSNVTGQPLLKNHHLPPIQPQPILYPNNPVIAAPPLLLNVPPPQITNLLQNTAMLSTTPTVVTLPIVATVTLPPPSTAISVPPPCHPPIELASIPPPTPIPLQSIPQPEPLNALTIPHPAPIQVSNIPTPTPIQLNEIPKPKPLDLLQIPTPNEELSALDPPHDFIKNIPPPNKSIPPPNKTTTSLSETNVTIPPPPPPSVMSVSLPPPPPLPNKTTQGILLHTLPPPPILNHANFAAQCASTISVALATNVAAGGGGAIPSLMAQPILPPPGMGVVNVSCPPPSLLAQPPPGLFASQPPPVAVQMPPMNVPPPSGGGGGTSSTSFRDLNAGTPDYEAMASLGRMVAQCGQGIEDVVRQRKTQDPNLWFLYHKESAAFQQYQQLIAQFRREIDHDGQQYKPEDIYEPEMCTEDDDPADNARFQPDCLNLQKYDDCNNKRKRKSRWGEKDNSLPPAAAVQLPQFQSSSAHGAVLLSKVTRTDPGLLQYTLNTFGTTNLDEDEWKRAEDHYKINLLYQDMVKKREALEKLQNSGRNKYDYDSDEEIEGGTWEHKLRDKEMMATQLWAQELNRQAEGKHHIGDFLPPDELKRFMEKSSACKEGRELNFSDYKEFKIKEDNIGFQMLQKLGWSQGQGLGFNGAGIVEPVNKAANREHNQGLGMGEEETSQEDEYEAYRKRMMLAYRFRPNPLNNPRRPYY